jgi:hypothetical protein
VYCQEDKRDYDIALIDNLYYFMKKRDLIGCSVVLSEDYFENIKIIEKLLDDVVGRPEWKELPIIVCGLKEGGMLAAIAASKFETIEKKKIKKKIGEATFFKTVYVHKSRIKKIVTINSAYDWPFKKLSIKRAFKKSKCHIPLIMLYSFDGSFVLPKSTTYRRIKKLKANGVTLGKEWFSTLDTYVIGNKK